MLVDNTNIEAGQIPVSVSRGGTGGVTFEGSSLLTSNDLQHRQVTVTNAEMLALTTPVELVPAPGANKLILVEKVCATHNYLTDAFNDQDLTIEYDDGDALVIATIDATNFLNGVTASTIRPQIAPEGGAAILDAAEDIVDKNVAVIAGTNPTSGGGTLTIDIWYRIADLS